MNKIAFIGAGAMAEAVVSGLVSKNYVKSNMVYVTNKENEERLNHFQNKYHVMTTTDKETALKDAKIVFIATKPYDIEKALIDVRPYINHQQLFISVVAGISTDQIQKMLQIDAPIIRSMPNTSASIGYSATAIAKGKFATNDHINIAEEIFSSIGKTVEVKEEEMHIVTAISGSGPAYIYYLVEAMQEVAVEEGLAPEVAEVLINQTIIGAGNMLENTSESVSTLRENVTSPNGTTQAGLETLKAHQFQEAIKSCVKSAKQRSIELGKENE